MKHTRIDQLSDGIFAIVMTVLVFEITLPDFFYPQNDAELWRGIIALLPHMISYILSFSLLFTYWRAHHFFVSIYAKNVNTTLSNINALFFLLIALVPFSSSLLGRFPHSELAISLFGIHIILIGLTLYGMRNYVFYSDSIKNPEITTHEIHGSTIRTLVPVVCALIAISVSFVNTTLSIVLFTLAVLFNFSSTSTSLMRKIFKF